MPLSRSLDPADPRLADYRATSDAELLRRRGVFIAEGRLVVRRLLLESAMKVRSVLVTEPARASLADALDARSDVDVLLVPQQVMDTVAGFSIHRGCLAVAERPAPRDWRDLTREATTLVVLERISDADNVGSLFRSAEAFGADAVLLDDGTVDPLYRKAIRTSMGAALRMPFSRVPPDACTTLRTDGWAVIALAPTADSTLEEVARDVGSGRLALVLGHEGEGLRPATAAAATHRARIPIATRVDSLNVAIAGAIALYEVRGRGGAGLLPQQHASKRRHDE